MTKDRAIPAVSTLPLRVYRLRGSQAEMGRQFGALAAADGGYHAAVNLYVNSPTMAATMAAASLPHSLRSGVERTADALLGVQRKRLQRRRDEQFPAYTERTRLGFEALGVPKDRVSATFVMDVLQNLVGNASRTGMFERGLQGAAVSSCSSLAVWGAATVDGELRHARNFDFPGGSIWDRAPVVVFCEPDDGLRYGFVTTRGLDAPGITCFNEAGLTLTVHTRFHREVNYRGPSVIDLGHEIIRTSNTLATAINTTRRSGAASTWGLMVSSAAEHSAALLELTGARVDVVDPTRAEHLTCTNRYVAPPLRDGQVAAKPDFALDSDDRQSQLERFVADHGGTIDTESLQWLLGDLGGVGIVDLTDDVQRVSGSSVVAHHSVASVVCVPSDRTIDVSVGPTPTGFGPYATVEWSWDGPVGIVDDEVVVGKPRGRSHKGEPITDAERAVSHRLAEIVHTHLEKAPPAVTLAAIEHMCSVLENEPSLRRAASQFCLITGDYKRSVMHASHGLGLEGTPGPRAKLLLARSRAHAALNNLAAAQKDRDELLALDEDAALVEHAAARRERDKPLGARQLGALAIDILHFDAH